MVFPTGHQETSADASIKINFCAQQKVSKSTDSSKHLFYSYNLLHLPKIGSLPVQEFQSSIKYHFAE
jgi:hypothetical protein